MATPETARRFAASRGREAPRAESPKTCGCKTNACSARQHSCCGVEKRKSKSEIGSSRLGAGEGQPLHDRRASEVGRVRSCLVNPSDRREQ